jgi:hypothetical protein
MISKPATNAVTTHGSMALVCGTFTKQHQGCFSTENKATFIMVLILNNN